MDIRFNYYRPIDVHSLVSLLKPSIMLKAFLFSNIFRYLSVLQLSAEVYHYS